MRWSLRWATPESVRERQPLSSMDGRVTVSYVGRLDNRADLIRTFGQRSESTDGDLLAASLSIGIESLRHCVGDFAVAAWNAQARRLWLARDGVGQRALYYRIDADRLAWSTDLGYLARLPPHPTPNEGLLAELLVDRPTSQIETVYRGIYRLPGGHAASIEVGASQISTIQYWRPACALAIGRDAPLIAELRERLSVAVAACLRTQGPVGADLSGGLDSSTVFALAARELGRAPRSYSLAFPGVPDDDAGHPVDESLYFREMTAAFGGKEHLIHPLSFGRAEMLRVLDCHGLPPEAPNFDPVRFALLAASAADGNRVHLTGVGGDTWLTGSYRRLGQLVRRGQLVRAWQFIRDASMPGAIGAPRALLRAATIDLLPVSLRPFLRRLRPTQFDRPAWLSAAFANRVGLDDRLRALPAWLSTIDEPVVRGEVTRLYDVEQAWARESAAAAAADAGIDVRHPFMDRRLVEFLMTLPDDLRLRHGRTRFVLREAMRDLLPARVRDRARKGNLDVVYGPAFRTVLDGMSLRSLRVADLGWVDGDSLRRTCAEFVGGQSDGDLAGLRKTWLWHTLAIELWLRAMDPA